MSATGIIDHVVRPHVAVTEDKYLRQPPSAVESFLPSNMPMGVARIVSNILALFEARTMAEHCRPMPIMSRDVVWDAPPFLLSRKGSVRVSTYFFKFFARQRFVPSHIEVRRVGLDSHVLEVSGVLEVFPRRTILLPATLLLPEVIPIRATLQIGVDGPLETGAVELVVAKWHNLPSLPNFIRAFNGTVYGNVPHLLEPIWSYLPEFIGDDFYRRRREATFSTRHPDSRVPMIDAAKDVVTDTATGVMDYGVSSVGNLREGAGYIFHSFMEAAGFTVGRARAYTGAAANLASSAAGMAFNTATTVAGTAAGAAAGVAQAGANLAGTADQTAVNTASYAAGTAANLAGTAAHAAADTASYAANTAANAAGYAANTAAYAAGTAVNVAQTGAQKAAEVAGTAYENANVAANRAYDKAYDNTTIAANRAADTTTRVAGQAYDTTTQIAGKAYDTTANVANRAYDNTASAANTVYTTGARAADSTYETGREGARIGVSVADRAGLSAQEALEDAKRGYEMGKNKPVEVPVASARAPAGVTMKAI